MNKIKADYKYLCNEKRACYPKLAQYGLLLFLIAYALIGLTGCTGAKSAHEYYCPCVPTTDPTYCTCNARQIQGAPNPFTIGIWATPSLDAVCTGVHNGHVLEIISGNPGFQVFFKSPVTCTPPQNYVCIGHAQACRLCTNWSLIHKHDVTITKIICQPVN